MQMGAYLAYAAQQRDEDPLYLFDAKFGDALPELLADYAVPPMFQQSLFDVLGAPHRLLQDLTALPLRTLCRVL
jgi:hypothetical protein